MIKTKTVLEMSVSFIHLTRLIAREDFIDSFLLAYYMYPSPKIPSLNLQKTLLYNMCVEHSSLFEILTGALADWLGP
jgi:hypothetical protein